MTPLEYLNQTEKQRLDELFAFLRFPSVSAKSEHQPDMAKCGGLLETRKIAAMAEIYHIPIAPHGVASTLGKVAFAHVCATVPNFMILEWAHFFNDRLNRLVESATYEAGFIHIPEKPGIGVNLNDDAIKEALEPGYEPL